MYSNCTFSFNNPTIIILGGLERGQDFNELTPYMKNVKQFFLAIGECRKRVEDYAKKFKIPVYTQNFKRCHERNRRY